MMLFETAGGRESPFCLYENYEAAGGITKNQSLKKAAEKTWFKSAAKYLYTCSIWMIAISASGIIYNWLSASAANEIVEQAGTYKNGAGKIS